MENNLYILARSTNTKITGSASPSVEAIYDEENINYSTLFDYFRKKIPLSEIKLPKLKLRKRGKLTDLLSASIVIYPSQLLISKKFLQILREFSDLSYQVLAVDIIDKAGQAHEYYIIHHHEVPDEFVDYERTVFTRFFNNENKTEIIPVKSYEDFINIPGLGGAKQVKALFLKDTNTLPRFFPIFVPSLYIVKEKVANKLLNSKITGICLIPFHQGEDFTESLFIKTMRIENPEWEGFKHT